MLERWAEVREEPTYQGPERRDPSRQEQRRAASLRFGLQRESLPDQETIELTTAQPVSNNEPTPRTDSGNAKRLAIQIDVLHERLAQQSLNTWLRTIAAANAVLLLILFLAVPAHSQSGVNAGLEAARAMSLVALQLLLMHIALSSRMPIFDRLYESRKLSTWRRSTYQLSFVFMGLTMLIDAVQQTKDVAFRSDQVADLAFVARAPEAIVALCAMAVAALAYSQRDRSSGAARARAVIERAAYFSVAMMFTVPLAAPRLGGGGIGTSYLLTALSLCSAVWLHRRVVAPIAANWRHQLRVRSVVDEGPGVVSVYFTGKHLDQLNLQAGQFCTWRVLNRSAFLHPQTHFASAMSNGNGIRITVKASPAARQFLDALSPGRRVLFSGPYGRFTAAARTTAQTVMIASGMGITAVRNLAASIETAPGDLTVIYQVRPDRHPVLVQELQRLADRRGARLHIVDAVKSGKHYTLSPDTIAAFAPEIGASDVFVCGAPDSVRGITSSLAALQIPRARVHVEYSSGVAG